MRNLYRGPDKAYASMDFTGVGYITETDFLNSMICKRVGYTQEEIKDFLLLGSYFKGSDMSFDSFKKTFFPHLYLI